MLTIRPIALALALLLAPGLVGTQSPQPDQCALFTTADVAKLLGTGVEAGEATSPVPGCQWFGQHEESYVIVQVVGTTYWLDPRQAPDYQPIPGVGQRAYSHWDAEGGWRAMARTDRLVASVMMIGRTATQEAVVTLLRRLVQQLQSTVSVRTRPAEASGTSATRAS
jgi:hypothetical protein